jgi:enoyl-CoA hydratase/carnithine racemase
VKRVVAPNGLVAAARVEAQRYMAGSPFSQRLIKELTYRGLARDLNEHMREHVKAMRRSFRSADHKEGVDAFLEQRDARFTGR